MNNREATPPPQSPPGPCTGTYLANETDQDGLRCGAGNYCPSPSVQLPCPAVSYCVDGTIEPLSCDFEDMLESDPYMRVPEVGGRVLGF